MLFFPLIFAFVFILLSLFVMISTIIVIAYVDLSSSCRMKMAPGQAGQDILWISIRDK